MSLLARALDEERWKLVSLCLLLGLVETLSKLPPDSVIGLFDVIDGGENDEKEG